MIGFDARSTQYSVLNAYWLARASQLAYDGKTAVRDVTRSWGLDNCEFVNKSTRNPAIDTQAFVAANDVMIVVAFRGTENLVDWITDARIKQEPGPLGGVHRGFLDAFNLVWKDVKAAIDKFDADDKPRSVWITGHSLGGALATVAAARMIDDGEPVHGLYTYGQPRVGDKDFAREFDGIFSTRAFRHVNNHDIVTRVPPRRSPGGLRYRHVGTLKYFDDRGELHDDIGRWDLFLSAVRQSFSSLRTKLKRPVADHDMGRYVALLKNAAENGSAPA